MAVTIRPEMDLLQIAQTRAGEDFVRTWMFGQDRSGGLVGVSGPEGDEFEDTLMDGTEIDGAVIEGTLIEGTLMEGAAADDFGSEIERSSTLGK